VAGWRFFAGENGPANIQLEPSVALNSYDLDEIVENFEKVGKGFIDFLLLDAKGLSGHGATLVSLDQGFSRFPGLNWLNPAA